MTGGADLFAPPSWPYAAAPRSYAPRPGEPHRRCRDCRSCRREPGAEGVTYHVCSTAENEAGRAVGEINPFSLACVRFKPGEGSR